MAGQKLTTEQLFMAFPLLRYYMSDPDDEEGPYQPPELMGSEVFEK